MTVSNLPVLSSDAGLSRYMREIQKFPMLEAEEEYMLGKAFADHNDVKAAHKLVTSHFAPGGENRHGLPRLWPAGGGAYFRGQYWPHASR